MVPSYCEYINLKRPIRITFRAFSSPWLELLFSFETFLQNSAVNRKQTLAIYNKVLIKQVPSVSYTTAVMQKVSLNHNCVDGMKFKLRNIYHIKIEMFIFYNESVFTI